MKRLVIGCCLLLVLIASCGGGKKKINPFDTLSKEIDSLKVQPDSMAQDTAKTVEDIIPATADESFADFFYNFASDPKFQTSRVIFPLSSYHGKQVKRIGKEEWKFDPFFSKAPAYTVLFDNEEDMELEKDTSLRSVQVEWIYLHQGMIKRYYFERKKKSWFLEAINMEKAERETDGGEDFLTFYEHFANDSAFQRSRLKDPLAFVTSDPDDEFEILETTLEEGQWFAFRPPMMKGKLTNVRYGQTEKLTSKSKIVEFKGFGNGFNNVLYFERNNGKWELVKFEDLSD